MEREDAAGVDREGRKEGYKERGDQTSVSSTG